MLAEALELIGRQETALDAPRDGVEEGQPILECRVREWNPGFEAMALGIEEPTVADVVSVDVDTGTVGCGAAPGDFRFCRHGLIAVRRDVRQAEDPTEAGRG